MMQTHSHPKFPGWESSWPDRFEESYGYDPERAKELLAEAGYPNGFSITQQSYPRPGLPEMQGIGELINSYWKEIGIDAKFQPVERSVNTKIVNSQKTQIIAWLHTGSFTEPTRAIFVYHYTGARGPRFEDPFFDVKYEALEIARTAEERSQLIREMGEFCFEIYCSIPLFWVPFEFMIDPKVIAEWKTPGVFGVLDSEYIKLARVKGVSETRVVWKHALRNASIAPFTLLGLLVAQLVTGTVVTETVFSYPGVGLLAVEAIRSRDFQVMQTIVIIFAVIFVGINLLVDVIYAYIDPRIRLS